MRTEVVLYCPFNRDFGWITQAVIEEYAGACIRGGTAPDYCVNKWSQMDPLKVTLMHELLDTHPDFEILKDELVEEFGIEHFIGKPRSKEYHIKQLELAIEATSDAKEKAALYKELREYCGWTPKPTEVTPVNITNNIQQAMPIFDKTDQNEVERMVMSFFNNATPV